MVALQRPVLLQLLLVFFVDVEAVGALNQEIFHSFVLFPKPYDMNNKPTLHQTVSLTYVSPYLLVSWLILLCKTLGPKNRRESRIKPWSFT